MHSIAVQDSRVVRGNEALRNRMCDLNKYIYIYYISLNIYISVMVRRYCCHPISLSSSLPPLPWSSPLSSWLSSSSSSSSLSHLPAKKKELLKEKKEQILKSRVKDVVHSHIDFYMRDISGVIQNLRLCSWENNFTRQGVAIHISYRGNVTLLAIHVPFRRIFLSTHG